MFTRFTAPLMFSVMAVVVFACVNKGQPPADSTASGENQAIASSKVDRRPIFLPPGGGSVIDEVGPEPKGKLVFKLGGGESGSTFEMAEATITPNNGPPEHIHEDTDEAFYVIRGTFRVKIGDQTRDVGPGAFVFAPRGVSHVYMNTGKTNAVLLITASDTMWEAYMRDITDALKRMPPGPPDQKVLNAISDKYKMKIVGPPLGSGRVLERPRK